MSEIVSQLKNKGYGSVTNAMFTYFSPTNKMFVYCGKDPIVDSYYIPLMECRDRLLLKCRTNSPIETPTDPTNSAASSKKKGHSKRNKERKITEVIEKVSKWRQLYTGTMGQDGKIVKCSLEEASTQVGIAKKTLDDYLLQLRAGKKYGFDFNANKEAKIGVLRTFVKGAKAKDKHTGVLDENSQGIINREC